MGNTEITRFDGSGNSYISIGHNHDWYDQRHNGLYISLFGNNEYAIAGFSIDTIPDLIEQLQAVYDEFEENRPKTFAGQLEAARVGSVISGADGYGLWMKHYDGQWVSYFGDAHKADAFPEGDFKFVYEAKDVN